MNPLHIAHLSDLHFSHFTLHPSQFLSKKWLGNANFFLRRKKDFHYPQLQTLPTFLQTQGVHTVLLSGDLTCTAAEQEFAKAVYFVHSLQQQGLEVIALPGNHDHYTKKASKERLFYRFFPSKEPKPFTLAKDQIEAYPLSPSWWLLCLDTTISTPLFFDYGLFSTTQEQQLETLISSIPPQAHVILANHYPLDQKGSFRGEDRLRNFIKRHPQIVLYLHGHTHTHRITASSLPLLVDAGSACHRKKGSGNILTLTENQLAIQPLTWQKDQWTSATPRRTYAL